MQRAVTWLAGVVLLTSLLGGCGSQGGLVSRALYEPSAFACHGNAGTASVFELQCESAVNNMGS